MKRIIPILLAVAVICAPAFAKEKAPAKTEAAPVEQPQTQGVLHGQFAQLLVKTLGLARFLPAVPTDADCFRILAQNGIAPADGWKNDGIVRRGDLARVLVQAMDLSDEVENPEDPNSWIATLEQNGISLDRISTSVAQVEALPQGITQNYETTDPLFVEVERSHPSDTFLPGDLSPNDFPIGHPAALAPITIQMGSVLKPKPGPKPTPH